MSDLFGKVLELSWQAGLIALAVMAVRLLLRRRVSRRAICLLWALVALRLLLPVSMTVKSSVSVQPEVAPVSRAYQQLQQTQLQDIPPAAPGEAASAGAAEQPQPPAAAGKAPDTLARALPWLWCLGMGAMAAYMLLSIAWMRFTLRRAERVEGNVYRCTRWRTPFVLGVFAPRIYVPAGVPQEDLPQVLAHERCHIRRGDHVCKPLAFLLLAVHWFNPVLWMAYILLGRDMENACDETVLRDADAAQRAAYSRALVSCAAAPRMAAVCPLAFGEVAVKERVKNVLHHKKPALWAAVMLVIAALVIGACLLTKPAHLQTGTLDAEKLFSLRTPLEDNAAVGAILEALGMPEMGGEYLLEKPVEYEYYVRLETAREPYGVVVRYAFAGALPQRTAEWNREMARRGYLALALIDNAEWLRWEDVGAEGETPVSGTVYAGDYVAADYNAVRGSAAGLQALMDTLQACLEDGSIAYYPGDALSDFTEITPWPILGEDGVVSAKAEDYGIVYGAAQLPDWETVPLSYLCAYYLNGDGAYAEGAMDVLAHRYQQAPSTVKAYLRRLAGQQAPDGRGDAAEVLLQDISRYAMSQLTGGLPVAASYERDQLSISVSEVYSVTYRTVTYDENYSEDIPVYEVGPRAQLTVIKGEGFTLYGRYREEDKAVRDGEVIDLLQAYPGLGMDGQYAVQFRYYDAAQAAQADGTLTFNDNGAGMVSYPAYVFRGSGYRICILSDGWQRLTPMDGWNDLAVDGSPALNGKPAEVWQSTEDISARLYVVHLGAMTLAEAQTWAQEAGGGTFSMQEDARGGMMGIGDNGGWDMIRACDFPGTDASRFAVVREYPMSQTEHLGYALGAMVDTFTAEN